jgi:hypothetical protein
MLVKNTFTLTTFSKLELAAFRTADRFWMQSSVIWAMLEEGWVRISPEAVQGIWPEQ